MTRSHRLRAFETAAVVALSLVVIALALLALDDITTGAQPDFWAEYAMLVIAATWFGGVLAMYLRRREGAQ